jgi:phenylglyoxylate dehydrogenase epsilon subunit
MARRKLIIVGAGSAGLSALKQIRRVGCEDDVKLVTMEDYLPYSPTSLPYLLANKISESDLPIVDDDFFSEMDATLVKGTRVESIDASYKRIIYANGQNESYDTVLIATGSEPVVEPLLEQAGIFGFHTIEDYFGLKQLKDKTKIAVLGAGLVGMELAVALAEIGHEICIIAPRERILRRYFDTEAGTCIVGLFAEHSISINLNWGEAAEVKKAQNTTEVTFASGKTLDTEVIISCTGVQPRISFLSGSKIKINKGILVDNKMEANIPGVFATGDVAEAPDFLSGRNGLALTLPSAVEQGKVAGSNMAGEEVVYEGWLPMNIFNFFGHLALSVGKSEPDEGEQVFVKKEPEQRRYRKLIFNNDRLVGATFLDTDVDGGVFQYLIRKKLNIGNYKEALLEEPKDVALWFMLEAERKESLPLEA